MTDYDDHSIMHVNLMIKCIYTKPLQILIKETCCEILIRRLATSENASFGLCIQIQERQLLEQIVQNPCISGHN